MTEKGKSKKELLLEYEELKLRLAEADDILRAIRQGEVDGILTESAEGDRIYTLQGAEEPYRVFFEAMNEGAVTMTLDGTILYCNRRFAALAEVALEKVMGMSFLDFVTEDARQAVAALLSEPGPERRAMESSLKAGGGKVVPVNISVNPLETKDMKAVCAVVTDLSELMLMRRVEQANKKLASMNEELLASQKELQASRRAALNLMEDAVAARKQAEGINVELLQEVVERKRAAEELRQSEYRYRSLADSVPSVLMRYDRELRIVYLSPKAEEITGTPARQFIGKTNRQMGMPEDLCLLWESAIGEVFRTGLNKDLEFSFASPQGPKTFYLKLAPEFNSVGAVDYVLGISTDITERKKAEKDRERLLAEVQRHVAELDAVFKVLPYLVSVHGQDGKYLRVNQAVIDLFGFDPTTATREEIARRVKARFPDGTPLTPGNMPSTRALNGETVKDVEYVIVNERGEEHVLLFNAIPLKLEGWIYGAVFSQLDITERKKAEESLLRLNKAQKALSDSSQAVIRAKDEQQYLNDVCKIIIEDCGYSMTWIGFAENDEAKSVRPAAYAGFEEGYLETLKLTWADTEHGRGPTGTAIRTGNIAVCRNMLTDPDFAPWREEAIKRGYASSIVFPLRADGGVFGSITMYSKETDPFTGDEVRLLTELTDNVGYGIKIMRMRVAREQAEEALRESEERYRSLFSNLLHGFAHCRMLYDEGGRPSDFIYLDVNSSFTRLTGLRDVAGRKVTEVIPGIREAHPELFDLYGRVALTGRPESLEIEFKPLGKWLAIAVYSPLREHFVAIFDDITERKKAEEELLRLSEVMATRNLELESLNKELESFIYSVSHDLRAPIRTMSGFARVLYDDYSGKLDAKGQDYLNRILKGSDKSAQLIDDLLRLSKISRQELVRIEVNLSKKALKVAEELREANPGRKVEVVVQEGITASADPRLLELVLSNLIGNSWKFTSKTEKARIEFGSFECGMRSAEFGMKIQEHCEPGKTVYFIRDNGAGFDMTYADKMFWPFHRLHTEQEFEGTGIGLTIVERVIRRHGGTVWAEGEVGKGAVVYFTL